MSRHKQSIKKLQQKLPLTKEKKPLLSDKIKKILSSFYFWLGVFSLLIGLVLAYYSSLTKIKISPDVYLDPADPSSVSFLFENASVFPVYDLDYQFYLRNVVLDNNLRFLSLFFKSNEPKLNILVPSQSFSDFIVFPFNVGKAKWVSADIDIEVTYKPKFLFWSETISKRFIGKTDATGNLKWISAKPLDDLPPKDNRSVLLFGGKRKY